MDAEFGGLDLGEKLGGDAGDLGGKGAAVGVAGDEVGGAGLIGGLVAGGGVGGVLLVAVEGVLAIEDDFATVGAEVGDGVADHGKVFFERGAQDFRDVENGGLADEGDDRSLGFEEQGNLGIFFHRDVRAPGAAERGEFGVLEVEFFGFAKELDVFLVGAGPAALDVVHAEGVEALGDAELVGPGEIDAFALRAVAERGVVKGDGGR
jgi:hypothetical protein